MFFLPATVWASSTSAYQEYLQEFDKYRTILNDFKVARAEYLKFKTLASEEKALTATKAFVSQRSYLLRSYLVFVAERIKENPSMSPSDKSLYSTMINNEIQFLAGNAALAGSIAKLSDANGVSEQLTSHYTILQSSAYQTIVALKIADLGKLDASYYEILTKSNDFIQNNKSAYAPETLVRLERWMLQIQNKRSIYQQKIEEIQKENATLKKASLEEITASFTRIQKALADAKQYLGEGASYLQELTNAMQYKE